MKHLQNFKKSCYKVLFGSIFITVFATYNINAQRSTIQTSSEASKTKITKPISPVLIKTTSFIEVNGGVAKVATLSYDEKAEEFFPGLSVLYGQTFMYPNKTFIEYQIGLAFPSIVTGKIGIGKDIDGVKFSVGIRPFPFTAYAQMSIPIGEYGGFTFSVEGNPIDVAKPISVSSAGNINIGYRWNIKADK